MKTIYISVSNEKCQNQCQVFINLVMSLQRRDSWVLNEGGVQDSAILIGKRREQIVIKTGDG